MLCFQLCDSLCVSSRGEIKNLLFRNRYDHTAGIQTFPGTLLDTCIHQASRDTMVETRCLGGRRLIWKRSDLNENSIAASVFLAR